MNTATTDRILLYNGECAVCRRIAAWVDRSSAVSTRDGHIVERAIGDDPAALRALNPALDIWDAYGIIHLLMPGGEMKTGGEAVAEVLRSLPNCRWFAWTFRAGAFGIRPFQLILNLGYTVLAEMRPLLGCASCGIPNPWVKAIGSAIAALDGREAVSAGAPPHLSSYRATPPKRGSV